MFVVNESCSCNVTFLHTFVYLIFVVLEPGAGFIQIIVVLISVLQECYSFLIDKASNNIKIKLTCYGRNVSSYLNLFLSYPPESKYKYNILRSKWI